MSDSLSPEALEVVKDIQQIAMEIAMCSHYSKLNLASQAKLSRIIGDSQSMLEKESECPNPMRGSQQQKPPSY